MPKKEINAENEFCIKDHNGLELLKYELHKNKYYEADLGSLFLSLYRGLQVFDHPVVYRIDLNFLSGFQPSSDNQELKAFTKSVKSHFWKENTRFPGKSSFKIVSNTQAEQRNQKASQYADRFKPIIVWVKERSTEKDPSKTSIHGEVLNRFHYHLVVITPIFHEKLIKEKLRDLWEKVCISNQKAGCVDYCQKNPRILNSVGYYKLYGNDGGKVRIHSNKFRECFKRCAYLCKTKQKPKCKYLKTTYATKDYQSYEEQLIAEIKGLKGAI